MIQIKVYELHHSSSNVFRYWSLNDAYKSAQKHGIATVVTTTPNSDSLSEPTVESLELQFSVDTLEEVLAAIKLLNLDNFIAALSCHVDRLIKARNQNTHALKQQEQISKISKMLEGSTFLRIEQLKDESGKPIKEWALVFITPSGEEVLIQCFEPKGVYIPSLMIGDQVLDISLV